MLQILVTQSSLTLRLPPSHGTLRFVTRLHYIRPSRYSKDTCHNDVPMMCLVCQPWHLGHPCCWISTSLFITGKHGPGMDRTTWHRCVQQLLCQQHTAPAMSVDMLALQTVFILPTQNTLQEGAICGDNSRRLQHRHPFNLPCAGTRPQHYSNRRDSHLAHLTRLHHPASRHCPPPSFRRVQPPAHP
jgi:hypothetical protein